MKAWVTLGHANGFRSPAQTLDRLQYLCQVEACLHGGVVQLQQELRTWAQDAALWARTWHQLMEQLQGV